MPKPRRAYNVSPVILGVVAMIFLWGCGVVEPGPHFRYRLTVEIDTPHGLRSGSSVIAVKCGGMNLPGSQGGYACDAKGEAVVVDMLEGNILVALLSSTDNVDLANYLAFAPVPPGLPTAGDPSRQDMWNRQKAYLAQPREIPSSAPARPEKMSDGYPTLVTFTDPANPRTALVLDPEALDKEFGNGTRLKRITVQITNDPVTRSIRNRLPWLNDKSLMTNPAWRELPDEIQRILIGLSWQ